MRSATTAALDAGVEAALDGLFALRRADGSWQGTLPSSAVSTGSALIALVAANPVGSADLIRGAESWLRATQAEDGGWGDAPGGPSTLNATAIAVAALQVMARRRDDGDRGCGAEDAAAEAVRRGLARIDEWGGLAAVADRERCTLKAVCQHYLAEAGLYEHARIARMPVEVALLPRRLRQKLSFTVPGLMSWGLMHLNTRPGGPLRRAVGRLAAPRALAYLEDLAAYDARCPGVPGAVEESALMGSIVLFGIAKAGLAEAGAGAAIAQQYGAYLRATVRPDGSWPVDRDIEFSCTMYIAHGLLDAAFGDWLAATGEWARGCQRTAGFAPTGCPPGGWGWSMPSGWPDTDDTAGAVTTLARLGAGAAAGDAAGTEDPQLQRGLRWLLAMQNRNGSWGCFARDAGVTMDAPCAVMTAHAAIALHAAGGPATARPLAAAVRWFTRAQRPDGAYSSVWFRGLTCGTARVLDALGRLGRGATPTARKARDWLLANQHPDGGWGDGAGAPPSAEETAWAVLGLVACGEAAGSAAARGASAGSAAARGASAGSAAARGASAGSAAARGASAGSAAARGAAWLLSHQRPDGRWPAAFVGVYFLGLTYWCDHIADGFALQALARYQAAISSEAAVSPEAADGRL
jgi:squalene-hopene/tetraprenyl-beta-curcumene cyclase